MPNSLPINHAPSPRNKYLKYIKTKKKKIIRKIRQQNNQINLFYKGVCQWKVRNVDKIVDLCELSLWAYNHDGKKTLKCDYFIEQDIDTYYDEFCDRQQLRNNMLF